MADLQIKITKENLDIFLQGDNEFVFSIFCDIRKNGLGQLNNINLKTTNSIASNNFYNTNQPIYNSESKGPASFIEKKVSPFSTEHSSTETSTKSNSGISLEDFILSKNPTTNIQKTTVFVYYLSIILQNHNITLNNITNCYKKMNYKVPTNLQQNIFDICGSKYGYMKKEQGYYHMTEEGKHFVEHVLPKKISWYIL